MTDSGEVTAQAAVDSWTVVGGGGERDGSFKVETAGRSAGAGLVWAGLGQGRRLWLLCSGPELCWGHMHHTQHQAAGVRVTDLSSDALFGNIPPKQTLSVGKAFASFSTLSVSPIICIYFVSMR